MPTHEHEIVEPTLLADATGRFLNPAARGWSRFPILTANLKGTPGRKKYWDYWCLLTETMAISVTYANVDYLGIAAVWWSDWSDPQSVKTGGYDPFLLFARGIKLPDKPAGEPLVYDAPGYSKMEITDVQGGTRIVASWTEADGRPGKLDVFVELPEGHESLNVVIPWSETLFQYTSKHQARPASGSMTIGDTVIEIGGIKEAWGVLDVGRGRWPYDTTWNWGGGAGRSKDGKHIVGWQCGGQWTAGTGFTENGVIVDGKMTKIGQELTWQYDWNRPMDPWKVYLMDGSLEMTLKPEYDKHSGINAILLRTEVHQVFGKWYGHLTTEEGKRIEVDGILGFAEESRSRW
jgi:hypothetical protein